MEKKNSNNSKPNPRDSAGFFSRLTFSWLFPLLKLGHDRPLETEDLYSPQEEDKSKFLGDFITREWDKELESAKRSGRKPSYVRSLVRCFWWPYLRVGLLAAIEECVLRVSQPICLGGIIRAINGESGLTIQDGWLFAVGLVAGSVIYISTHHPFFFGIQRCGMQIRIASCSLLYRKALRLSKTALSKTTVGHLVNLLSNDVNRFDTSVIFLHYLWIGPLQLIICTVILWYEIGPSCLAGLIILVLFVPFQSWMGKMFSRLRLATAHRTDERVRIMDEIVNAIRVIKMYTWEQPFTKLIEEARKKEIDVIMKTNYYRSVNMSLFFTSAKVIVFISLLTYVLTGNVLTAEKVFVTSALINNVRLVMTLFFPFGIAMGSETLVSCKRIQEFLEMEEKEATNRVHYSQTRPKPGDCCVVVSNITARWSDDTETDTLNSISCSVKPKEILAVIGPVGAGKSSLLQAILGELPITAGEIKVQGRIAYASQEPWVFSGTVRQNILFGQEFNEKRYNKVLKVCALERDLDLFPQGDQTLVGEKGVSLSGGQKARVSLARTVYFDADVYLLDDPLSAVDAHVGRHLFNECIMGFLQDKVCILNTHQLQYLKNAHNILVLKEGKTEAKGSYNRLVNSGIDFASLMADNQEQQQSLSQRQDSLTPSYNETITPLPARKRYQSEANVSHGSPTPLKKQKNRMNSFTMEVDRATTLKSGITRASSTSLSFEEHSSLKRPYFRNRSLSLSVDDASNIITISALGFTESNLSMNNAEDTPSKKIYNMSDPEFSDEKTKKVSEESKSTGSVSLKVYLGYFLAGGGWCVLIILLLSNIVTQVLFSGSEYWLAYWTNGEQLRGQIILHKFNLTELEFYQNNTLLSYDVDVPEGYLDTTTNVYVYSAIILGLFLLSMFRTVFFFMICMKASKNLHKTMFAAVIRVPIKFFDTHPIGHILNRFSKDIGQIDDFLPNCSWDFFEIFLNFFGIITVIGILNYWILVPTAILAVLFILLRRFYLTSARDIKRLEGVTRSPVFSHLSSSLLGLTTIRAFKVQDTFKNEFDVYQDQHSSAWFLFLCATRWFGIYLDWISTIYSAVVTFTFMSMTDALGGDIGLAISQAMLLTGMFQWGVRQSAEVENQMTSVERVLEYSKLESEAPLETEEDKKLNSDWPNRGEITFKDVDLKYDEDDPPVLKQLNFSIHSTEKIGIVGRTGAGKSSLLTTLFRLTEPTGDILLDGVPTHQLGLHKVRGAISIIPQDPTLFSGTLRHNIDPFSQYSDDQLWNVLDEVQLKDSVSDLTGKLEASISEGGSNLSVGQRQLVCLARAILKHNRVLVMDEATANVDPKTDALIQKTIREKFADCTVLTIAHRLHTIMDCNRIMVMDAGRLKEFDEPYRLARDDKTIFSELLKQTGDATAAQLIKVARTAYYKRKEQPPSDDEISKTLENNEKNLYMNSISNGPSEVITNNTQSKVTDNNTSTVDTDAEITKL